ncbi:DUF4230 domain-containing protein [Sphingomonas sp. BGYR3]|uniref:DUF4230 domain-containing protein n=1 Tax=Sphingomonas sp. BGYR3 TaxID=2975483 RepID=UPI0021A90820|nr:DUF4230 domain-containing protein [Sphingomonas sp. BGYR3]MDG5487035.1 DUF4230 domain-containing protein [Sphingomonas sp. BGYR3]
MTRGFARQPLLIAIAVLLAAILAVLAWLAWQRHQETEVVTRDESGVAVTRVITARLSGAGELRVSRLNGTIQATAEDVRWGGVLRSRLVTKAPYSVDYYVDLSAIRPGDLEWNDDSRTLIVNAPEVTVGTPNIDEGSVSVSEVDGLFVTRAAGQELARRASASATSGAGAAARSPERMAQAREFARRSVTRVLGMPLAATGYGDARVVVTFPNERRIDDGERWDVTRPVDEVLANRG